MHPFSSSPVTIEIDNGESGQVTLSFQTKMSSVKRAYITACVNLGGIEATRIEFNEPEGQIIDSASSEYEDMQEYVDCLTLLSDGDEELFQKIDKRIYAKVETILAKKWGMVKLISDALLENGTLLHKDIQSLYNT